MINEKVKQPGFYCACDTVYLNTLAKALGGSINFNAPWAHLHFHIFDGTEADRIWCQANGFSFSSQPTPSEYLDSIESRRGFWVNERFAKLIDLYDDSTPVIALDADSILVKPLTQEEFLADMSRSWVTVAGKRNERSLGSAVGFAADQARYHLAEKLKQHRYRWYLDQQLMDELLDEGRLQERDTKYSDYKMRDTSVVWTGKGERKNKKVFQDQQRKYSRTEHYATDENAPHLGGNYQDSDPATFAPSAWQYIVDKFRIHSVMDVGSGRGHAARWFKRRGHQVTAIEGMPDNVENSIVPAVLHDICNGPYINPVDFVNCIEVVEHIEEKYLDNLLTTLTQGNYLLMTHAVPGQKGYHHVNCQTSEYWIDHLQKRGFEFLKEDSLHIRRLAKQDHGKHIARNGMMFKRIQ